MTVIYLTEYNTRYYGVTVQNHESVRVQKFEDFSDGSIIYCVKPLETFLGKSEECDMTLKSGAFDKSVFDGNTILLKMSEENDKHRSVYTTENVICF